MALIMSCLFLRKTASGERLVGHENVVLLAALQFIEVFEILRGAILIRT